ncbi:MAG TPA: hypothetical protein PLI53_05835 [Geobacteraceae bacterium]|nr:hypothetical protein [Geobacteraceae bacterium]
MENAQQGQTELAEFLKQVKENFQAAGKPKSGWLRNVLKKIFG